MNYSVYLYILVMAVVTYLIRMLPVTLFRKEIKNRFVRSALYYMPYACLACMTVPAIWHSTASIVSGIAEYYSPEEMVGKKICILANLKPRVIRGIESKGMILMAKQGDGTMRLVTPSEAVANGAVIG